MLLCLHFIFIVSVARAEILIRGEGFDGLRCLAADSLHLPSPHALLGVMIGTWISFYYLPQLDDSRLPRSTISSFKQASIFGTAF
jgi:hypothetical protein